ncbi:pilin [Candidatus Parcubacteria bacterium]|nr:pilin [Patescibacteria group bacterium]MCG2694108.1 pilin [Candidatus Parcubacteria bacterium]
MMKKRFHTKLLFFFILFISVFFLFSPAFAAGYDYCCVGRTKIDPNKIIECKDVNVAIPGDSATACLKFNTATTIFSLYPTTSSKCETVVGCPASAFSGSSVSGSADADTKPQESTFTPIEPKLQINIPTVEFSKAVVEGEYVRLPQLAQYIAGIFKYSVAIISIVATIMIMVGGLLYLTSGGSAERVGRAKETISGAVIGLILALGSYMVLYVVNPDLVSFDALKIKLIKRQTIDYLEVVSKTGEDNPGKDKIVQLAHQIAQKAGISDTCMFVAIVTKESGANPGVIGHDENYQGPVYVSARRDFLMSGKKYSGGTFTDTFTPPFTTEAEYRADPAKYNKLPIKNDDKFDLNAPPKYGLDWRFSHGFGLGQYTLKSPSSEIPKLLTVEYTLQKSANLFKSNLSCAANLGYTGEEQLRAAYFAYAAGCGALKNVKDKQTFYTNRASTRAMEHYNKCKANSTATPTAQPDPHENE